MLDRLQAPKRSELSRTRKVATNGKGCKQRHVSCSLSSSESKGITPQQRLKQFPDENLVVSCNKWFCEAYKEEVSLKCSSVRNHIKSAKHKSSEEKMTHRQAREKDIAASLKRHNEEVHLKSETCLNSNKLLE